MPRWRILIVDDEEPILDVCSLILQGLADTEIVLEQRSSHAVERLRTEHFDVLLTDINMPEVTGIELLRIARHYQPHLSVLVFTGLPTVETAADSFRLGAVDYLEKPFAPQRLLAIVNRLLQEKRAREDRPPCQSVSLA
jgi:DNA-binding NtrC family response regulator